MNGCSRHSLLQSGVTVFLSLFSAATLTAGPRVDESRAQNTQAIRLLLQARQVGAEIRDREEREVLLGDIAEDLVKAGDLQSAHETIGLIPSEEWKDFVQKHIVQWQIQNNDFVGARETAKAMTTNPGKAEAFCLIGSAQSKAGLADAARQSLSEASEILSKHRLELTNASFLQQLALTQSELGDKRGAIQTALLIPDDSKNRVMGDLAAEWVKSGDVESIRQVASVVSQHDRPGILGLVVEAYATQGDLKDAFDTARNIGDEFWKAVALERIAGVMARTKNISGALSVVNEIKDESEKIRTLTFVSNVQEQSGDSVGSTLTYQQAVRLASTLTDPSGDKGFQVASLAQGRAEIGDTEGAVETLANVADGFMKVGALRLAALAQSAKGDNKGAESTLLQAIGCALSLKDATNRAIDLYMIASAQSQIGYREEALITFRQAVETAATIAHELGRNLVIRDIAREQASGGDVTGALITADRILDAHLKDQALHGIAVVQAGRTSEEEGLKTASMIQTGSEYEMTLVEIAEIKGERSELSRIPSLAERIHSPYMRTLALIRAAEKVIEHKNK